MDLNELRDKIDAADEQILKLFADRMEICRQVADYKKENGISIMQSGRENQILDKIRANSPESLKDGAAVLFQNIMDISKSLQSLEMVKSVPVPVTGGFYPDEKKNIKISCQGTAGSYSEAACKKLFASGTVMFEPGFEDVFEAVESGKAEYGILPIQNSTIGSVSETYALMEKHDVYINALVRVEITHCLAAKKGSVKSDISCVYSKEEALSQCGVFLKQNGYECRQYANTAMSAEYVANGGDKTAACICSEECASLYGLEILDNKIADAYPNYTRFICFSKDFTSSGQSDTISVCLSIPHKKGSLYRLLTKFAVSGLNLSKIENKSVAGSDFEVIFYLDFDGRYSDPKVQALLNDLSGELSYFRFLGNFYEVI